MKRPHSTTAWLRAIRAIVTLLLVSDVGYLILELSNPHVQSVATVDTGDIFGPDAYLGRMHPELSVNELIVGRARDYSNWQTVLWLISHRPTFALVTIPMLILAGRLLDAVMSSDPFTLDIVRRLRVLGLVVLIGGALSESAEYAAGKLLVNSVLPAGQMREWAQPDIDITLWWVMPAFILLAVAEIVRRGCALRDELDTVI